MNATQFVAHVQQLQQQGKYEEADAEVRAVLDYLHETGIGGSSLQEYVADLKWHEVAAQAVLHTVTYKQASHACAK